MGGDRGSVGLAGNDLGPERGMGCRHAMEANEMKPGTRNERRHHEMGGAIAVRGVELQNHLAGRSAATW